MEELTDQESYEAKLIEYLRREADEVKDCFTRFSFQAVAVSAVALGLIVRFQPKFPLLGFASVAVVLLALSIARIGIHKYSTANRIHGFELYLDRVRRIRETPGWKHSYRKIGWEEAVRAWRTIQPTVFRLYYKWGPYTRNTLKPEFERMDYPWFEPEKMHTEPAVYYAGSYLKTMLSILFTIVAFALASMIAMIIQLVLDSAYYELATAAVVAVSISVFAIVKFRRLDQRRRLLEGGILCIHSCAVMWHMVVVAHHRAVSSLPGYSSGAVDSFQGYTRALSQQATELHAHLGARESPHSWIHEAPKSKSHRNPASSADVSSTTDFFSRIWSQTIKPSRVFRRLRDDLSADRS